MVHAKPQQRATWDPNGKLGWYIGPAMHHYRCMNCYLPATRAEIETDTITFIPHTIAIPEMQLDDFLRQAASDIVTLLTNPPKSNAPSITLGNSTRNRLLQLATLLNTNKIPTDVLRKQQQHTINEAQQLQQVQKTSSESPSPTQNQTIQQHLTPIDTSKQQEILNEIRRLARVFHQKRLQRILHGHKTLRKKFHPTDYFTPTTNFNNVPIPQEVANHIFDDNGKKQSLDALLHGEHATRWTTSLSNELGRLTQGNDAGVTAQDAMDFIDFNEVPKEAKVTYANFVCDYRPLKDKPWRVRLVVGGDKLMYEFDSGSPTASLLETKILANSVISDAHKGARFMSLDLKDFFLSTPMGTAEYMRIPVRYLPQDIIDKYNLATKLHNGYIYCRIKKGMYGLKQAAILAYKQLKKNLAPHGYEPIPHTDGMWKHKTRKTTFCLCVDDFGVKYFNKDDANHLIAALQHNYQVKTDWTGKHFCGLTFDWKYHQGYVDVSMPGYIQRLLAKLQHLFTNPQYSPYLVTPYAPLKKGQRQYAQDPDTTDFLTPTETTVIQQIVGSLLYYGRAIDSTILPALNTIALSQAKPTEKKKS